MWIMLTPVTVKNEYLPDATGHCSYRLTGLDKGRPELFNLDHVANIQEVHREGHHWTQLWPPGTPSNPAECIEVAESIADIVYVMGLELKPGLGLAPRSKPDWR
jgi:hypothetical protein